MKYVLSIALIVSLSTIAHGSESSYMRDSNNIDNIAGALELYKLDTGNYPTTEQGLRALLPGSGIPGTNPGGYVKRLARNYYGHPYQYRYPGIHNVNGFDLWSFGKDDLLGGEGTSRDYGNWLEGDASDSAWRRTHMLEALPMASLIGFAICGFIYIGISSIRLSDGISGRRSFIGKSIWIAFVFFLIYWALVFPLIVIDA